MKLFTKENCISKILFIFAAISFCLISFAYLSQYFLALKPCILCLYQRIPFFIILIICISYLFLRKFLTNNKFCVRKIAYFLCLLMFFANSVIAFYHIGVENKIFQMTKKCENDFKNANSVEELQFQIANANLSKCDEIQFLFLGFSMASWNFIICLTIFVFGVVFYRNFVKRNLE